MHALSGTITLLLHLSDQLESYQKEHCELSMATKLKECLISIHFEITKNRRNKISKSFFKKILSRDSCLHSFIPAERNTEALSKLRNPTKYPIPHSRTKQRFGTLSEIGEKFILLFYHVFLHCIT